MSRNKEDFIVFIEGYAQFLTNYIHMCRPLDEFQNVTHFENIAQTKENLIIMIFSNGLLSNDHLPISFLGQ